MIESDLLNALRWVTINIDGFGLSIEDVTSVTAGNVNEALFRTFFELKDLSSVGIGITSFFIQHQTFSNSHVPFETPSTAVDDLLRQTGCESFECLRSAEVKDLFAVEQNAFGLTDTFSRQIDRLEPFRAKYVFMFLLDFWSFTDDVQLTQLTDNRVFKEKVNIILDYYYQQKLPYSAYPQSFIDKRAFYNFKVHSSVGSTINATTGTVIQISKHYI